MEKPVPENFLRFEKGRKPHCPFHTRLVGAHLVMKKSSRTPKEGGPFIHGRDRASYRKKRIRLVMGRRRKIVPPKRGTTLPERPIIISNKKGGEDSCVYGTSPRTEGKGGLGGTSQRGRRVAFQLARLKLRGPELGVLGSQGGGKTKDKPMWKGQRRGGA